MSAPAAIPVFGDAYLADTQHLTLEEHGAYFKLLICAWRTDACELPADDKRIATMLGVSAGRWAKIAPAVMAFWTRTETGWHQKRLTKERSFVEEKRRKNSLAANAMHAAKSRKNKDTADANAHANAYAPPPLPTEEEEEREESKVTADAVSTVAKYAFAGRVIKLTAPDLGRWRAAYTNIDIVAELQSRDDWLSSEVADPKLVKKWFHSTSKYLSNRNDVAFQKRQKEEADDGEMVVPC